MCGWVVWGRYVYHRPLPFPPVGVWLSLCVCIHCLYQAKLRLVLDCQWDGLVKIKHSAKGGAQGGSLWIPVFLVVQVCVNVCYVCV